VPGRQGRLRERSGRLPRFCVDVGKGLPGWVSEGALLDRHILRCGRGNHSVAGQVADKPTGRVRQTRSRRSPEFRAKDE
jgi:hypothetical protein